MGWLLLWTTTHNSTEESPKWIEVLNFNKFYPQQKLYHLCMCHIQNLHIDIWQCGIPSEDSQATYFSASVLGIINVKHKLHKKEDADQ